jgi:hypothetical protein
MTTQDSILEIYPIHIENLSFLHRKTYRFQRRRGLSGKLNDKFDTLSAREENFNHKLNSNSEENKAILSENKEIIADNKRFNNRFDDYQ